MGQWHSLSDQSDCTLSSDCAQCHRLESEAEIASLACVPGNNGDQCAVTEVGQVASLSRLRPCNHMSVAYAAHRTECISTQVLQKVVSTLRHRVTQQVVAPVVQARAEGIRLGSKQLADERLLKHELQKALDRRKHQEQVLQEQQAATALQSAAHVASLEQHIQDLKVHQRLSSGPVCLLHMTVVQSSAIYQTRRRINTKIIHIVMLLLLLHLLLYLHGQLTSSTWQASGSPKSGPRTFSAASTCQSAVLTLSKGSLKHVKSHAPPPPTHISTLAPTALAAHAKAEPAVHSRCVV